MPRAEFIDSVSALDGRTDTSIRDYFVETKILQRIRQSRVPSLGIVGLKGSGKTTLFRLLTEDWTWEPRLIVSGLSPTSSTFASFVERTNCLQFEGSVMRGMALYILKLLHQNSGRFDVRETAKFASWGKRQAALLDPKANIARLLGSFQGLSILGLDLDWSQSRKSTKADDFKPLSQADDALVWEILEEFEQFGVRVRIVVDDPDRLFTKGSTSDPNLLAGYILGTNIISRRLKYVQFVHILKGNVYNDLLSVEEIHNLPHDYFEYISWSRSELSSLVEARMKFANVADAEIFYGRRDDTLEFMIDQIRNGPRDLLRFSEIILKSDPNAKLSTSSARKSLSPFKRSARQQMETIYGSLYEGIETFVAAIFEKSEMTVSEFRECFLRLRMSSLPISVDYGADWLRSADRALRALVDAGTVDVVVDGKWRRPFEAAYFSFDPSDQNGRVRKNTVFC